MVRAGQYLVTGLLVALCGGTVANPPDTASHPMDTSAVQQEQQAQAALDVNAGVRNTYIWRGFRVSRSAIMEAGLGWSSANGHWSAGFWGGYSFNGFYTEFDHYIKYSNGGLTIALWDINNFTNYEGANYNTNAPFFSYERQSSRFVDLSASYQFPWEEVPLTVSWATILLGRDFYMDEGGNPEGRYSTYTAISAPLWQRDGQVLTGKVGGAFALHNKTGSEAHFYGSKPNIVNVMLQYSRTVELGDAYEVPVSFTGMWNPEKQHGAMQLTLSLF